MSFTETSLHFTGPPQFTSGDSRDLHVYCMLQLCACEKTAALLRGTSVVENQERDSHSFILKVLGPKLKPARRNATWKVGTRKAAV